MTLKGGTSQACAACKYQRRKCTPGCPLAPYFPADKPKIFANAHKLFGVSNILKILKQLDPSQQNEAMSSIIYQSNLRDRFPVLGCVEVIHYYWNQIRQCQEELQTIQAMIALYHHHNQQQQQLQQQPQNQESSPLDSPSQLQLGMGMGPVTNDAAIPFPHHNALLPSPPLPHPHPFPLNNQLHTIPISQQNYSYSSSHNSAAYNNNNNNNNNSAYAETKETNTNPMWVHQHTYGKSHNEYSSSNNNNNSLTQAQQSHLAGARAQQQLQVVVQQEEVFQDFDAVMNPYFDTIDDRQSYIESKSVYDSSPESSLIKDTPQSTEHVAENELKSAAACFSLTNA